MATDAIRKATVSFSKKLVPCEVSMELILRLDDYVREQLPRLATVDQRTVHSPFVIVTPIGQEEYPSARSYPEDGFPNDTEAVTLRYQARR